MVGLRSSPPADQTLALTLIENGWIETMAMGAWMPAWAGTGAALLFVGYAIKSWDRPSKTWPLIVAAAPMAISVVGFIIHMCRAAIAISAGRKLALTKQPGGAYAQAVSRLTTPTPWVLVPQVALGIALAIVVTRLALANP